ncbi:MAG: lytic transglycosylase domain-containing protein [Salinibacterium sp.]|nr:lytic transglycosylase domain-containing protein [Salinibacterium sp.]
MGTYWRAAELRALRRSEGGDVSGRHSRTPWSLPVFASFVSLAFVLAAITPPVSTSVAAAITAPAQSGADVQSLTATGAHSNSIARDGFTVTKIEPPKPTAPAVGEPDPGSAQAIALQMLTARGFGSDQFDCLVALWNRESRWNVYALNASSGAYGIPQSLPGDKMASAGADWATNPATQITWGLTYIEARYGDPCGAWGHSEENNWY